MVTNASDQPDMLSNYQLRLPGYEGPLDVLLRLIERNQLEITDVSLVAVTSQFLDYVAAMTEAPRSHRIVHHCWHAARRAQEPLALAETSDR